jgi:hypothetical protein
MKFVDGCGDQVEENCDGDCGNTAILVLNNVNNALPKMLTKYKFD